MNFAKFGSCLLIALGLVACGDDLQRLSKRGGGDEPAVKTDEAALTSTQSSGVKGLCSLTSTTTVDGYAHNTTGSTIQLTGYTYFYYYNASRQYLGSDSVYLNTYVAPYTNARVAYGSSIPVGTTLCTYDVSAAIQQLPAAPVNLEFTSVERNAFEISWTRGTGGDAPTVGYRVYYARSNYGSDCASGSYINVGNTTRARIPNLLMGTSYWIHVCAISDEGVMNGSLNMRGYTIADPSPEVRNLAGYSSATDRLTLTWTSGGGTTNDYIYKVAAGGTAPANCADGNVVVEGTTATIYNLQPDSEYSVRLCSRNVNRRMSAGATITLMTQDPSRPTLPFTDNFNRPESSDLGLAWDEISGDFWISGDKATSLSSTPALSILTNVETVDVRLSAKVILKQKKTTPGFGLVARYRSDVGGNTLYVGRIRQVKAKLMAEIVAVVNGRETILAAKKVAKKDGTLVFQIRGTNLMLTVDKVNLSVNDTKVSGAGGVGMLIPISGQALDEFSAR